MPLKKGNTTIGSIYKGTTPIGAIYKGTTLIFENAKWLPYSYEYLYYDLIPQKVNKNPLLPQEYQEVEYIESSGTQYIDTGFKPNQNTLIKIKGIINNNAFIFGTRTGYSNKAFGICSTSSKLRGDFNDINQDSYISADLVFTAELGNYKFVANGTNIATFTQVNFQCDYNLVLFANNNGGNIVFSNSQIDYFQIYDNNTLVRNFIPCYRKSDNVIGLYDSVNGTFYTNAGSGTFTKGADVYRVVKNKAKITKIEGNSYVENQWCPLFVDWAGSIGITFTTSNGGRKATLSGTATGWWVYNLEFGKSLPIGSKVLVSLKIKNPNSLPFGYRLRSSSEVDYEGNSQLQIYTTTKTIDRIQFYGNPNYDYTGVEIEDVQIVCLTQAYPFDTPTTLTDNRIQALLNRGYIAYNTGEIKSTGIGEIASEPYNLFDEVLESGYIDASGNNNSNANRARSKNYISVLPNRSYTILESSSFSFQDNYSITFCEYDKNKNFIKRTGSTISNRKSTATLSNETWYVRFYIIYSTDVSSSLSSIKICFYETNAGDLGYKPHTQPQTITFKYQGSGVGTSHDTMEVGSENVVFTKNMASVDLGSLGSWEYNTSWVCWRASEIMSLVKKPSTTTEIANIICNNYPPIAQSSRGTANSIFIFTEGRIGVVNGSTTTQPTGALEYQLATPQTITIPRKKLGVVDLGSLSWTYIGGYPCFQVALSNTKIPSSSSVIANIYCSRYIGAPSNSFEQVANSICIASNGDVRIHDTLYNDATTFKNAMQGILLFYETNTEVADIINTIGVEAGGTITSNSDVLPNATFNLKAK